MSADRARAWAGQVYRWALRAYPTDFRSRLGGDLARTFEDGADAAWNAGGAWRLAWFTLRCVLDVVPDSLRLRWDGRRGAHTSPGFRAPSATGWSQDVRDAWRGLRRRPASAAAAVFTLALGVGVNAALFGVVHAVLLRPFEYREPTRLVVLQDRSLDGGAPFSTTGGAFRDWDRLGTSFDGMALMGGATFTLTDPGRPAERVFGSVVSHDFFAVLGVEPALGRGFRPEETEAETRVLVLSDGLWRGRFGADPTVVGRDVDVDGEPWRVVGVMPPVGFPSTIDGVAVQPRDARWAWTPLDFSSEWVRGYRSHVYTAIGRLDADVSLEAAEAELATLTDDIRRRNPDLYGRLTSSVVPLREVVLGDVERDLWILFGGVLLVLLVSCANLTHLLFARTLRAAAERSVRAALGATRARLFRRGVIEALLVGALGGVSGWIAAAAGAGGLDLLLPADLPRRGEIAIGLPALGFSALVALLAAVAAGVGPAWRGAQPVDAAALAGAGRRSGGRSERRVLRGLVVAQLAIACTLLVGAGLLVRSVVALRATDLGVDTKSTAVGELMLPRGRYPDRASTVSALQAFQRVAAAVPGVTAATLAYDPPLNGTWTETFDVVGRASPPPGERPGAWFRPVAPGYFRQLGIPVLRGRALEASDDASAPGVVVVNEAFVREHFPGEDPIGRRIRLATPYDTWGEGPETWEIVGVVADVRFRGARRAAPDAFYFSLWQAPVSYVHVMTRSSVDPVLMKGALEAAVANVDPLVPLTNATTLQRMRDRLTAQDRANALLLAAFALLALLVAGAGVFGVLSHAVARRVPELAVRLALGARPATLRRLVLAETVVMVVVGLLVGGAGAVVVGRLLSGLLYGVPPWDPWVLVGVVGLLSVTALAASWLPARAAAGTDPITALRRD